MNVVYVLSFQTLFERVVDYGFHQRFIAMRRDHVCPSSNNERRASLMETGIELKVVLNNIASITMGRVTLAEKIFLSNKQ